MLKSIYSSLAKTLTKAFPGVPVHMDRVLKESEYPYIFLFLKSSELIKELGNRYVLKSVFSVVFRAPYSSDSLNARIADTATTLAESLLSLSVGGGEIRPDTVSFSVSENVLSAEVAISTQVLAEKSEEVPLIDRSGLEVTLRI